MGYRKYQFFLDLFGIIGVVLCVVNVVIENLGAQLVESNGARLDSIWGNLATEMVGIWLGVRIIDFIIRKNEKENSLRILIVRSTRFLIYQIKRTIEHAGRFDLDYLESEI